MPHDNTYLTPLFATAACVLAIRFLVRPGDRRSIGILICFACVFACISYWMNLAHNGSYYRLASFVLPLGIFIGLAHALFPTPPYEGAPMNKMTFGAHVVCAIGLVAGLIVCWIMNFNPPARQFLIDAYFQLGLP